MKRIFICTTLFFAPTVQAVEPMMAQKNLEKIYAQLLTKNFSSQQTTSSLLLASACLRHTLGSEKSTLIIKEARRNVLSSEEKVVKYLNAFRAAPLAWKMPRKSELDSMCEGVLK